MKSIFIILILLTLSNCISNKPEAKLNSYLKENYEIDWNIVKSINTEDNPIYYDKDNFPKLERINIKIAEDKTGYIFYKSTLETSFIEYSKVDMIFAVPKSKNKKVFELKSPTFTDISKDFLRIFSGIKLSDSKEKRQFVTEISHLFEIITYKGKIKNIKERDSDFSSELWKENDIWRILKFTFDNNKIIQLEVLNPKK